MPPKKAAAKAAAAPTEEVVEAAPAPVFTTGLDGETKLFNKWCVSVENGAAFTHVLVDIMFCPQFCASCFSMPYCHALFAYLIDVFV